jgi:hypothetical protein
MAPGRRDGVIVLANIEDVDAGALASELLRIVVATPADAAAK